MELGGEVGVEVDDGWRLCGSLPRLVGGRSPAVDTVM